MRALSLLNRMSTLIKLKYVERDNVDVKEIEELLSSSVVESLNPWPEAKTALIHMLEQFKESECKEDTGLRLRLKSAKKGIYVQSQYERLRGMIVKTLNPWPEAKSALAQAIIKHVNPPSVAQE